MATLSRSAGARSSSFMRFVLLVALGCVTTSTAKAHPVEVVSSLPPGCRLLGPVAVEVPGFANGRQPAIDVETRKHAVSVLRDQAASKGATHLVVTSVDTHGTVLQDATASGRAYECPR